MKKNNKKYLIALALLPAIAAWGAAAWLVIKDAPQFIASTRANLALWNMMQSEGVTAEEILRSPYLDRLSNDDLWDLIDESMIMGRKDITAVLMQKVQERKNRG